jgi:hypothetical protein
MKLLAIITIAYVISICRVNASDLHPNIVVILCDDLGRGDYSGFGTKDISTPNIDRVASEGMTFDNFYANSCVCAPSRAALLTGKYPDRAGVPGVIRSEADNNWGWLSPKVALIPYVLKTSGYHSALIGKWHLGFESPNLPNDRGFDEFNGFLGDMMDNYTTHLRNGKNYMRHNTEVINPVGHATDLFTQWACDYLQQRSNSSQPFFLYLAYNAPHEPIQPPQDWLDRVKNRFPGITDKRARIVALIEHLDSGIGKVLDKLDKLKLTNDTIVIINSDNGGVLKYGGYNGPWRGDKQHMLEGGLRVPGFVRWPGKIEAGSHTQRRTLTMDIFATLCDVSHTPPPTGIDGVSFLPTLLGGSDARYDRQLYFCRREGSDIYGGKTIEALISGDWKIIQDSPFTPIELYNIKTDPFETTNMAVVCPDVVKALAKALRANIQRGGQVPWQKPDIESN